MSEFTTNQIINGLSVVGDGNPFPIYNKATGEVLAEVASASVEQAVQALDAANKAFIKWSALSIEQRCSIIKKYKETLVAHRDEIIEILIKETGKVYATASYDFDMIPNCLDFFCSEVKSLTGEVVPDYTGEHLSMNIHKPIGVVVGYLAWNFPLLNVGYKIGPALAAGCTVILKPSSQTPLATIRVVELAKEAGVPDGVINVIAGTGSDLYKALNSSTIPSMLTLIGSSATGQSIIKESATSIKKFSLELGGNAPVVVMKDADINRAAFCTVDGKIGNAGQVCVAPNRVFVHTDVKASFVAEVKKLVAKVTLGTAKDEGEMVLSPLVSEKARTFIKGLVDDAVAKGAVLECGGDKAEGAGFYFQPTVLTGVTKEMRIYSEEIFGPVISICSFDDSDDVVALANDTEFGLAAYLYTNDLSTALNLSRAIDSGSVCVNEPFYNFNLPHGGCKQSGIGKDCSTHSLMEYFYIQRITMKF